MNRPTQRSEINTTPLVDVWLGLVTRRRSDAP